MTGMYLIALLFSLAGLATIDYRYKLAVFNKPKQSANILILSILVFIIWDIIGIKLGIFFIGQNEYLTGIRVGEFPIEELFFLLLLNYCSLLIYLACKKINKQI